MPVATNGQSALNLHITGVGLHLGDKPNYRFYENSLDELGNFVTEPLVILSYQRFLKATRNSLQISQGLYSDAAAQMAGFTYFAFKKKIIHSFKNVISVSIGPNLSYRKDWHTINGYIPDKSFKVDGQWEYKWLFAAEINYYYYLGKRSDFAISLYYGLENKTMFFPSDPVNLLKEIEEKRSKALSVIEKLNSIKPKALEEKSVKVYEGKAGLKVYV